MIMFDTLNRHLLPPYRARSTDDGRLPAGCGPGPTGGRP